MNRVLVLFAHPRIENSRINSRLIREVPKNDSFTFHDLYEAYPDFNIDVEREKQLLVAHDVIVWQHPLYWYSCPPLLKQWIDMVLEFGWAYGKGGDNLTGKLIFNSITSGGNSDAYCPEGYNCFTIPDFLKPFLQTARLCHMEYLPPFAVMGAHKMSDGELETAAMQYRRLLEMLEKGSIDVNNAGAAEFLNELVPVVTAV